MEIDEKLKRYKEPYAKKYSADGISEDELAEYLNTQSTFDFGNSFDGKILLPAKHFRDILLATSHFVSQLGLTEMEFFHLVKHLHCDAL